MTHLLSRFERLCGHGFLGRRGGAQCARQARPAEAPHQLLVGEAYNHFEMLETLANPYGLLGHAVLGQMRLSEV